MLQAVLPRRRHLAPLDKYTTQRQLELKQIIDERVGGKLDKQRYELAEPPAVDRKQSINSEYVRETVNLYRQQHGLSSGSKSKGQARGSLGRTSSKIAPATR